MLLCPCENFCCTQYIRMTYFHHELIPCVFSCKPFEKSLLQKLHLNAFLPSWADKICLFTFTLWETLFWHIPHLNSFFPSWTYTIVQLFLTFHLSVSFLYEWLKCACSCFSYSGSFLNNQYLYDFFLSWTNSRWFRKPFITHFTFKWFLAFMN